MGKKKGQQQRTKGNVLPSSSVRSADLLAKEGVNSGLGLFQALPSTGLGNIPELAGLDSITNTEFRTVLKKLYKRDVTTKLKGLAEFSELCSSCKQHEVLMVLPYWPRVYSRLFEDGDRRVRENSQKAMHAMVNAAGKNLALQLKNLMGNWFVSQCDPYAPSSLAAQAAIAQAFTGDKRIDAFVFCRSEILKCITYYLFGPQAKREKGSEQEGNNYHRIMASCLEAVSLFIQVVVKQKPVVGEIEEILDNSKFWKFQKHSNFSVRGGFYSVIESLCLMSPELVNSHLCEAGKSVFHRLDESNVAVCKPLYAAAVAIVVKCDTWYEMVDIQKGVIPGLCGILKSGCHGLGAYVLPSLLPILAKIPTSVDLCAMFSKIFEAMKACIAHDQVKPSKRGSELAATAYFELVSLSVSRVSKEVEDHGAKEKFVECVLYENVLHILEESFAGRNNKHSNDLIYRLLSSAIHSWEEKKLEKDADSLFGELCAAFWDRISVLIDRFAINDDDLSATKLIVKFMDEILHFKIQAKKAQRRSVKFETDNQPLVESEPVDSVTETPNATSSCCSTVQNNVTKIVTDKLIVMPWKESREMISIYKTIFEKLGNRDLFAGIYAESVPEEGPAEVDKVAASIERVLVKEIRRIVDGTKDIDSCVLEMFADIIFHTLRHCENQKHFPFDIKILIEVESSNPNFMIFLHFLSLLTSFATTDAKLGQWLCDVLSDSKNLVWTFLQALAHSVSICRCSQESHPYKIDFAESWRLLQNIMSLSAPITYSASQEGFVLIAEKLLSNLEYSKTTCAECYKDILFRFASFMMSCVQRNFDVSSLSRNGVTIWTMLMTSLLRSHCFCQNSNSTLLSCFSQYFMRALQNAPPFNGVNSLDVVDFLGVQSSWIKETLLCANFDDLESTVENLKAFLNVVSEKVPDFSSVGVVLLNILLPSSIEWESARGRFADAMSPTDREDFEDGEKIVDTSTDRYIMLLRAFQDVATHIVEAMLEEDDEVNWAEQDCLMNLAEELLIASAVKNDAVSLEALIDVLGAEFGTKLKVLVLEKSMKYGNIWPACVGLLGSLYTEEEWDYVYQTFLTSCESSEVTFALYQTMCLTIEFMPLARVAGTEWLSRIDSINPMDVSASDIYLFSLAVLASGRLDSESRIEHVKYLLDIAMRWRSDNESLFAFDDDFSNFSEERMLLNSTVADLFSQSVKILAESLTESQWDFILCALLAWMENISKSLERSMSKSSSMKLLKNACVLLESVDDFMSSSTAIEDPTIPSNLLHEWSEFFSTQINGPLVNIYVSLSSLNVPLPYVKQVCKCLQHASTKSIIAAGAEMKPKLSPDSNLQQEVQTILNHLCPLFLTEVSSGTYQGLVKGTAYRLISLILENLVTADTSAPPDPILNIIKRLSKDIEVIFITPDVEVAKAVEADSDEEFVEEDAEGAVEDSLKKLIVDNATSVLGYLLAWKLLINLTKYVGAEKKTTYIETLMKGIETNLNEDLLPKIFKLMIGKRSHFKTDPEVFFEDGVQLENIEHIAASLYQDFLVQMPAASRSWFNDLTKAVRSRVDKFTSTHVTPVLIEREFKAVQVTKQQQAVEGMEIIARPGAREVHAAYRLNEVQMEITVCLSPNHPLGPINVKTEKRAGVLMGQWRYWLLQITTFLQYQNGGIIDGLLLWKDKVDKRFEGLEECMICFSLVHGSSQSLPKLKCKTCKKKYHAECLYKWFDTSNNSTCPLCRSPMIFR